MFPLGFWTTKYSVVEVSCLRTEAPILQGVGLGISRSTQSVVVPRWWRLFQDLTPSSSVRPILRVDQPIFGIPRSRPRARSPDHQIASSGQKSRSPDHQIASSPRIRDSRLKTQTRGLKTQDSGLRFPVGSADPDWDFGLESWRGSGDPWDGGGGVIY